MPKIEEIEQFKSELNSLGHEPSILAERGERLEDISAPDQGLDADLDALLNVSEEEAENMQEGGPVDSIDEDADFFGIDSGEDEMPPVAGEEDDFSIPEDLLAGFDLEEEDQPEEASAEPAPTEIEDIGEDDFSFPDLEPEDSEASETSGEEFDDFELPEEPVEEDLGEFDLPEEFEEPQEAEASAEETVDAAGDEFDEFAFPEETDESIDFELPEEPGEEPGDFELPEETGEADESIDFELPEEPGEEPGDFELPDEEGEEESFEIPEEFAAAADMLSLSEESAEGEEELGEAPAEEAPFADEPAAEEDFSLPEEFSFEEEAPAAEEAFVEEDFSLPEEFAEEDLSFDEEPPAGEAAVEETPEAPAAEESEELSFFDDTETADFSMPEGFPFEEPEGEAASSAAPPEEDFSLPDVEAGDEDFASFGGDFDIPTAGDIEDIDETNFEVDEFSLGDLGEQFGEIEEGPEVGTEEALNPALAVSEEIPAGTDELELDDDDFHALQETLNRQPLNLRIAIEELIGEKNLAGAHLQKLVQALIDGASPKELAGIVGAITGKKIKIPSRYEKSSGAAFEAEKGTFAYAFRESVLPILRVMAAGVIILGLLTYLTLTFVYRPIHALILYNAGYEQLEEDSFREANLYFNRAVNEWRYKKQYFRYAEGFQQKRQYGLAAEKYEQLVSTVVGISEEDGRLMKQPQIRRIRGAERRALLDYAAMERDKLENFEHAEEILAVLLNQDKRDYDALLSAGDNYLAWGEYEFDRYEQARRSYATLMQYYGSKYELLFRMLRYFIRVDNYAEVVRLKEQFEADPGLNVEPDAYAELGGYLIDQNDLDDVKGILTRAMDQDETVPEAHYHMARYFRRVENEAEERKALDFAEYYLEESRPLGRRRLGTLIDTYNRQGEVDYEDGEYLTAEEYYLQAKESYEDARNRRILEPEARYGRIYRNLGNLYYYVAAEFDQAFGMFETAEANGYTSIDLNYKKGYIHYNNERYRDALAEFYLASQGYSGNENLLYATGNALFQRSDFFAAQGYYTQLLDELEQQRRNISVLLPQERPEDRSLIDRMIRVNNNLGVTMQRLSLASGDRQKFSRALVHLTDSTEYFDLLSRNPETMERTSAVNLGYLNQRAMLYPVENYELQIYGDLPLDLETLWLE